MDCHNNWNGWESSQQSSSTSIPTVSCDSIEKLEKEILTNNKNRSVLFIDSLNGLIRRVGIQKSLFLLSSAISKGLLII